MAKEKTPTTPKKIAKIIESNIDDWSDEEALFVISKFLQRVVIHTEFVQEEDGLIANSVVVLNSGDKVIVSQPMPLAWPMQPMPIPDAFEGKLN